MLHQNRLVLPLQHATALRFYYKVNNKCRSVLPFSHFPSYFFNYNFSWGQFTVTLSIQSLPPCLSLALMLPPSHSVTTSDREAALIYSQQLERDTELHTVSKCCYQSWQRLFYISRFPLSSLVSLPHIYLQYEKYKKVNPQIYNVSPECAIFRFDITLW